MSANVEVRKVNLPPAPGETRYELHRDPLGDKPYTVHKVEVIGPFATRDEAREWMLNRDENGV